MREGVINRKTNETDIRLKLELDGSGKSCIDTGCGFLDHMLTLFARHGRFDLTISCKGDTEVDYHHTTEDIGIALGDAFAAALGDLAHDRALADAGGAPDESGPGLVEKVFKYGGKSRGFHVGGSLASVERCGCRPAGHAGSGAIQPKISDRLAV